MFNVADMSTTLAFRRPKLFSLISSMTKSEHTSGAVGNASVLGHLGSVKTNLIATKAAMVPASLDTHTLRYADGCYAPWLSHNYVTILFLFHVMVQDVLGYLSGLAASGPSLDNAKLSATSVVFDQIYYLILSFCDRQFWVEVMS
ncbi:hypothetical protein BpHYR1_050837 [Brachionus plicatilis]|uniref:Uncharacterized protein n=1 Tax=Brachionus plicatilis TaxID=10195 RepID=A0A3M7PAT3_BRAPC|nr:hypothetical protein BpHYR1_050837 [Brachionus plicatilis]